MNTSDFQELNVWHKAMQTTKELYIALGRLPSEEKFALASQMRRAAVSIPSNIAEGQARKSPKDFIHFLSIARGSIAEIRTQIILCKMLEYFDSDATQMFLEEYKIIDKMTVSLMKSIQRGLDKNR